MIRKVRVAVTDDEGTVLDVFEVEVQGRDATQPDPKVARLAVLDVAESIQLGLT